MKQLYTTKFIYLFVIVLLCFTACSDKEDAKPSIEKEICNMISAYAPATYQTVHYEFNEKGFVIKIIYPYSYYGSDFFISYKYDSHNKLIKTEDFENGELVGYALYEYKGDQLTKRQWYWKGELDYTETYSYDQKGRLIKTVTAPDRYQAYEYDSNNNVVAISYYQNSKLLSVSAYENYDNKKSQYIALKGIVNVLHGLSKNNPGKITTTLFWDGKEEIGGTINYAYEYNTNGYPTKITTTDRNGTSITNLNYSCN